MTGQQHMPLLGASACVWRDGHVLMIQRAEPPVTGQWSLPGGHVEPGETVIDAAHRELLEETGVAARLSDLVGLYDVILRDAGGTLLRHYAIACYCGQWLGGEAAASGDAAAVRWVSRKSAAALDLQPSVADAIAQSARILRL